ncbi:p21-activated protein kinase [Pelomyxa schiedti]|nr:p21-activated protein kinase [Pelomyxa schiedti]
MSRRRLTCSRCGSCADHQAMRVDDDVITQIQKNVRDVADDAKCCETRRPEHHHDHHHGQGQQQGSGGRVKTMIRPIRGCPHIAYDEEQEEAVDGHECAVFHCIHKESRRHVAVWEIPEPDDKINSKIGAMIARRHPNIVEFIESYMVDNCLWIVTEVIVFIPSESLTYFFSKFMSGGCLTDVVSHFPELKLTEHQISYIILCVMKSLAHIHALNYIHRDITSYHILLSLDGAVKLADFAYTRSLIRPCSVIGIPYYLSVEYIKSQVYTATTDVWSTGILCMEMVEGKVPYQELHPMRALFLIPTKGIPPLKNPEQVSPQLASFISECLKPAGTRPSSAEMLTHEFLSKASCSQSLAPVVEMAIRLNAKIPPSPSESPFD